MPPKPSTLKACAWSLDPYILNPRLPDSPRSTDLFKQKNKNRKRLVQKPYWTRLVAAYTILVLLASSRIQITQDCWFKIDTQKDGCFWQCFATQPITRDRPNWARHVIKFVRYPVARWGRWASFQSPKQSLWNFFFRVKKIRLFVCQN